ncbi:hypothetical protein ACQP2E_36485 [Actinoplanes sp. CA-015351]|uniref:hypothetical protein n=1 Tax=Actinoplanes sp. CA-015351 TaxID=3239897 RepID=UPI003D983C49
MPQDDAWDAETSQKVARNPGRPKPGFYGAVPDEEGEQPPAEPEEYDEFEEIEVVPVRPRLSIAIAGFAALLAIALVLGSVTSGPDARLSYAIVLFGVQLLGLLAWTMALQPPAAATTAAVAALAALAADYLAVTSEAPALMPILYVGAAATVVALVGQLFKADDRHRISDSYRSTSMIVFGSVAYAILIVLTRQPIGTQAILVCCTGAGLALLVSRLTDAIFPKPRIAAQVPRGATGIVLGAMVGTLASAMLGSYLVLPFTPAKGAVLGLVAAVAAILVDLAVNFSEAGRRLAGDAPTFWLARHMQGPLGGFALMSVAAYALVHLYLS